MIERRELRNITYSLLRKNPLLVVVVITILSVFVAYVCFYILKSSAQVENEQISLGGAIAGFFVCFGLARNFYLKLCDVSSKEEENPLEPIKLTLVFSGDYPVSPPSQRIDYSNANCMYTVFSNGNPVFQRENVDIQFEDISPYIFVNAQGVKNPEFTVRIEYDGHQFISDSFSPIKREGSVRLG